MKRQMTSYEEEGRKYINRFYSYGGKITLDQLVKEENIMLGKLGDYTSKELEIHRGYYTIEERVARVTPKQMKTDEQRKLLRSRPGKELMGRNGRKILGMLQNYYSAEIEKVLNGESEQYPEFKEINITREAYNKGNAIAKKMVQVSDKHPQEIYLLALDERGDLEKLKRDYLSKFNNQKLKRMRGHKVEEKLENFVENLPTSLNERKIKVTDFYIPNQEVTPTLCKNKSNTQDYQNVINLNKRKIGWAHSHNIMPVFHSGTDNDNLLKIADELGTKRKITIDGMYFEVYVAPSLVFNALDSRPDYRLVSRYKLFGSHSGEVIKPINKVVGIRENKKIKLNIIDEKNNVLVDNNQIERDIYERVKTSHGFTKEFISRMTPKLEEVTPVNPITDNVVPIKVIPQTIVIPKQDTLEGIAQKSEISRLISENEEDKQYILSKKERLDDMRNYQKLANKVKFMEDNYKLLEEKVKFYESSGLMKLLKMFGMKNLIK